MAVRHCRATRSPGDTRTSEGGAPGVVVLGARLGSWDTPVMMGPQEGTSVESMLR